MALKTIDFIGDFYTGELITNQLLYQLSYPGDCVFNINSATFCPAPNFPILHNFASICSHVGLFVGLRLSFAKGVNMKSKLIADSIADHLTALTLSLLAEHRIHPCKCGTAPRVRARGKYVQLICVTCGRSTKQAQFPLLSELIVEWNGPDKHEVAFRAMVASL